MVGCLIQSPQSLIIGPVFLKDQKGILGQFQCLEFMSLIASGAGAAGIGHPILCNGANLAAPRLLFYEAADVYSAEIQSGDDIFLLLELKKKGFDAVFCKNNDAVVETENKKKLGDFIEQRSRWTFKSRYYRDFDIIVVAIIVLATNLLFPISFVIALFNPFFFIVIIVLFILKCIVDFVLLFLVADFFHRKKWLSLFVIHQFVYIFYVSWVGILGHLSTFSWKNRSQITGKR
jgi:cellulose synthase/poly-beta-1,6-N-acetylglucosamine synthase-like glycosyltransferase